MDEGYDSSVVIDIKPVRELAESPEREGGGEGGGISVVLDDDSGYDSDPVAGPVYQPFLLSAAESERLLSQSNVLESLQKRQGDKFYRQIEGEYFVVPPFPYPKTDFQRVVFGITGANTYFQGKHVLWRDVFGQVTSSVPLRLKEKKYSKKSKKKAEDEKKRLKREDRQQAKLIKKAKKQDDKAFREEMQSIFKAFGCPDATELFSPAALPRLNLTRSKTLGLAHELSRVVLLVLRYCVSKGEKKDAEHPDRTISIGGLTNRLMVCCNNFEIVTVHRLDFKTFHKMRRNWAKRCAKGSIFSSLHLLNKVIKMSFVSFEKALKRDTARIDKFYARAMDARGGESEDLIERSTNIKRRAQVLKRCLQLQNDIMSRYAMLTNQEGSSYCRDLQDYGMQMLELANQLESASQSLIDLHITITEHKTNNVLNILNFVTTIFLPLSFFSGIYGMNFVDIPELQWQLGYMYFWLLVAGIAGSIALLFVWKKWITFW